MNEYTLIVNNSRRTETVTVTAKHWMEAVDKAARIHMWAMQVKVLTHNGKTFPHSETVYV